MPITTSDISFKLSGGSENANPLAALGGTKSATAVINNTLNNLFATASVAELASGSVKYACIYIDNTHGSISCTAGVVYLLINTPSIDSAVAIGLGTSAVNGVEQTIADVNTAPSGVSFSSPSAVGSGISVPDIPAGQHQALWIALTINAGAAAFENDGCTLAYQCASL